MPRFKLIDRLIEQYRLKYIIPTKSSTGKPKAALFDDVWCIERIGNNFVAICEVIMRWRIISFNI